MSTLVLAHGSGHQGRQWDGVVPILRNFGHRTLCPDLPLDDIDANPRVWADVMVQAIHDDGIEHGTPGDVVLVGHSVSGLALPLVASRVPTRRMIYLCGLVPTPGTSWRDYSAHHPGATKVPWDQVILDVQGCTIFPWTSNALDWICHVDTWPDVPTTYVLCREDSIIGQGWARLVSEGRFGAPAFEMPGDHSPMLSRPAHLAAILHEVATNRHAGTVVGNARRAQ